MADPTREEFDAKLATVEARTEARFVELSGKIDRVADSVATLNATVARELGTIRADNKFTRLTIIVAIVASIITAIAALWITQANLLSAFQTGLQLKSEQAPLSPTPRIPSTRQ